MRSLTNATNPDGIKVGTIKDAMERYRFGRDTLMKIAESCNAIIRIGKSVRINFTKMDDYFDNLS